jgi:hypothetical protein
MTSARPSAHWELGRSCNRAVEPAIGRAGRGKRGRAARGTIWWGRHPPMVAGDGRRRARAAADAGTWCGAGGGSNRGGEEHHATQNLTPKLVVPTARRGSPWNSGERRRPAAQRSADSVDFGHLRLRGLAEEVDDGVAERTTVTAGLGGARNGGEVRRPGLGFGPGAAQRRGVVRKGRARVFLAAAQR